MQTLFVAVVWLAVQATVSGDLVRIDWSRVADRNRDLAAVRTEYVAAVNARDAASASAVYAPDALALFGDTKVLRGQAALGARLQDALQEFTGTVTLMPRSFAASGDIGSETGTFTVGAPGATVLLEGAYVAVYSRGADGRWKIAMEIRTDGHVGAANVW